ncbi:LIC12338 family lipoprotein [Leptospira stimsonii]|uniref:Lipoprotein n=1 Tax=Leptospira stimsonii TaxID=2202203 RepID=A0A4R9L9H6_9LEPT|nr:hypothetical protein [Leptospira stimsonii]RHX85602.1 hypothetical protein DLM75_20640 [Leptospira stimsonii]RHX86219.1 hypothetical protein DLM78_10220 [Leptospira stimsonii]TGK20363.1 hypothetical protein EHO98_09520 [Leptospira stimsonii]TGM20413.1 hypothetical protein EHQ90_02780 [Leptospira stimsonii]
MKKFRTFLFAGIVSAVVLSSLFLGACKKEEKDNKLQIGALLWIASQPYVEQSKTGFFIIVPKGIAQ